MCLTLEGAGIVYGYYVWDLLLASSFVLADQLGIQANNISQFYYPLQDHWTIPKEQIAIYLSALFYLQYGYVCFPCVIPFFVAERNDRSRASAKRSAGHSLHPDQSHSAVRNQELAPFLHDRRQDGQWQNSHLEDLTEHPEHHASQRGTWIQPRPCESWECLNFTDHFKIHVVLHPFQLFSIAIIQIYSAPLLMQFTLNKIM